MASKLSVEKIFLCRLIEAALNDRCLSEEAAEQFASLDRQRIIHIAARHGILPLLYDVLEDCGIPEQELRGRVEAVARQTVCQSYRLLFLTRYLTELLGKEQIPAVVLKGCSIAAYYNIPELRKSGDIDLMVRKEDLAVILDLLGRRGYHISEIQHANHHVVCSSAEGISVELHTMPAEPFNNKQINACMEQLAEDFAGRVVYRSCMGAEIPCLPDAYQAVQLLLHMLQHFLRAGFGLKLLCDWTVFWNKLGKGEAWEEFERLADEFGIRDFAKAVTGTCVRFLSLGEEFSEDWHNDKLTEDFLCDVFDAEEFGRAENDRMVALQGDGVKAYLREFHYQMKLNHPKTSKCVLLWPVLWAVTLGVFLHNNRRLQRGSVGAIMRSAGQRGRLVRQMGLWGNRDED